MDRRQFAVELSTRVLAGMTLPGLTAHAEEKQSSGDSRVKLDTSYLEKGLTAMARATGWFDAHWGAAVVAGYYLATESELPARTGMAIREQLDAMIARRREQFADLPREKADASVVGRIPRALEAAVEGGLRAHGHAVIFATLALRALRDRPDLAEPTRVDAICRLSGEIRRKTRLRPAREEQRARYKGSEKIVDATFAKIALFQNLVGYPTLRRPNFTHMITHTDAIVTLEQLGHPSVSRAAHSGHRVHIDERVPEVDPKLDRRELDVSLESILRADFWTDEQNRKRWRAAWARNENPNGDWVASGHLFKVLYSFRRLAAKVGDPELVRACAGVLLERYFDPSVQGG